MDCAFEHTFPPKVVLIRSFKLTGRNRVPCHGFEVKLRCPVRDPQGEIRQFSRRRRLPRFLRRSPPGGRGLRGSLPADTCPIRRSAQAESPGILENCFDHLRRRVPVGKVMSLSGGGKSLITLSLPEGWPDSSRIVGNPSSIFSRCPNSTPNPEVEKKGTDAP